jgi:hypothetical protein
VLSGFGLDQNRWGYFIVLLYALSYGRIVVQTMNCSVVPFLLFPIMDEMKVCLPSCCPTKSESTTVLLAYRGSFSAVCFEMWLDDLIMVLLSCCGCRCALETHTHTVDLQVTTHFVFLSV